MMLPGMREQGRTTVTAAVFTGIDRRNERGLGALRECRNLVRRDDALVAGRARAVHATAAAPEGLLVTDRVVWADGTKIKVNGIDAATVSEGQKQLIPFGQQVLVLPDKLLVDTKNGTSRAIEHTFTAVGQVTYTMCLLDGTPVTLTDTMTEEAEDGTCAVEAGQVMMASRGIWSPVAGVLVKIASTGIGSGFAEGDGVTIAGSAVIENGSYVLEAASENEITVSAVMAAESAVTDDTLTVSRAMPDLEFACEMDNRVWGVAGDTVYASRLGDATNWQVYEGLSTDSYAVALAAPGSFSGIIRQGSGLVIFRQDCFYKLSGNTPSTFRLRRCDLPGIPEGAEKSLTACMENLFFFTGESYVMYDGAEETEVSLPLGGEKLTGPVAWTEGESVCLCGTVSGAVRLYRLRVPAMSWTEETTPAAVSAGSGGFRMLADGSITKPGSGSVAWELQTAPMGTRELRGERLSAVGVGLTLPQGSTARLSVRYDGGEWQVLRDIENGESRTERFYVFPRESGNFSIRLSGTGDVTVHRLTVRTQKGGDRE